MLELSLLQKIAVLALPILFALTLHEVAHGWAALYCGDTTAKAAGRLSLNPIKHIDPIGTLLLPGILLAMGSPYLFGWAKPVPVRMDYLRNPKRDIALVSAAGPLANFAMALFWALLLNLSSMMVDTGANAQEPTALMFIQYAAGAGIVINLVLMALNLLPIPPLDGGRILYSLLPRKLAENFIKIEPYGFLILLVLLFTNVLNVILQPIVAVLFSLVQLLTGL